MSMRPEAVNSCRLTCSSAAKSTRLIIIKVRTLWNTSFRESCAERPENLTADDQSLDQRLGKVGGSHAPLHGLDIVGNTPKFHDLMFEIGDGKSGARISVAWLPNRA